MTDTEEAVLQAQAFGFRTRQRLSADGIQSALALALDQSTPAWGGGFDAAAGSRIAVPSKLDDLWHRVSTALCS
eukprot:COSAG05_NODE_1184_length_5590_cov_57.730468_4_plen_74_part_00